MTNLKSKAPTLLAALLAGALGFASLSAYASTVAVQDGFVKAGVNDRGTLGSGGSASPGILYDSSGAGNYGINDFLTPGSPFEGFYITGDNGLGYCSNNSGVDCVFATSSPTAISSTQASWQGTSGDGNLTVTNAYTLTTLGGRSVISISTTLTNNSGGTLSGLEFLRTLDPDPDVNAFNVYNTDNTIVSDDQACATGTASGETICIFSFSPFGHKAGVGAPAGFDSSSFEIWDTSPADYLAGVDAGNGDNSIGMGFMLGDLGAGSSVTFDYGYALGGSLAIAAGVPEPSGLAMFGLGLLGLLGLAGLEANRRKRTTAVRSGC